MDSEPEVEPRMEQESPGTAWGGGGVQSELSIELVGNGQG